MRNQSLHKPSRVSQLLDIEQVAHCVLRHYQQRGFSEADVATLRETLECNSAGQLRSASGIGLTGEALVNTLAREHVRTKRAQAATPAAIFAFSFGYRRSHVGPDLPAARHPGENNQALADIVAECALRYPHSKVAIQYEIGLALRNANIPGERIEAPARDWNTSEVLEELVSRLPKDTFSKTREVLVVGHQHHVGRCNLLISQSGLVPVSLPQGIRQYVRYDPREGQLRCRSAKDYVRSDFRSMCKLAQSDRAQITGTQHVKRSAPAWGATQSSVSGRATSPARS